MTGRRIITVVITAAFAVAMTASGALAASIEDWAETYCKNNTKFTNVLASLNTDATDLASAIQGTGDLASVTDEFNADLAKAAKLAKKTSKALKKAGAPDVKNGEELNTAAIKAYKTAARELNAARASLGDIDPADPTGASDALFALSDGLINAGSALTDFAFDTLQPATEKSTELLRALNTAC